MTDTNQIAESVSALAAVVTAGGIVLMWRQICFLRKQNRDDHDRSRRENAFRLLLEWSKELTPAMSAARKLAESFDDKEARALWNNEAVSFTKSLRFYVEQCLGDIESNSSIFVSDDGSITIKDDEVAMIRWCVCRYLNLLESVLSGYHNGVVDKKMIEEQFVFLVDASQGNFGLRKIVEAAGKKSFPAIDGLCRELSKAPPDGKEPLNQ